jgi:hypothetical protein
VVAWYRDALLTDPHWLAAKRAFAALEQPHRRNVVQLRRERYGFPGATERLREPRKDCEVGVGRWGMSLSDWQTTTVANHHICPVCSYPGLTKPAWADESPSHEICPSCGTQFGYDDAAGGDAQARQAFYERKRTEWQAVGMKWWSDATPVPPGWPPQSD